MKKKSIASLVNDAAKSAQLLVRVKAADNDGNVQCVTCGVIRHYRDRMQGGHFIGRKWLATKLLEENIHPQCACCNGPLKGNMIQYTLFMIDTYGTEFVEELERLKHESRKYYRDEVLEIIKETKELIKQIMDEKGI